MGFFALKKLKVSRFVPLFQWLPGYSQDDLRGDLSAGLTVGVMLIPQGMAYALLAGMPPIYGLYASTIPLILYAFFGTSRQLAVGPVAMVSLLIASGIGELATFGSETFISLAILLALMVGAIQLALGLLRLGFLVNFLSHPVISGFTSAAALIIGFNQLKHLLRLDTPRSNHVHQILIDTFQHISDAHIITMVLGTMGIVVIVFFKRYVKVVPGPLVVVILGILVVYFFDLEEQGVKIVGDIPSGFPPLSIPPIGLENIQALLPTALTISLIGFMESIAVAKAIQARHKDYKLDSNQELIGLGAANIGGSLFGAFPTTGGFSRTAVNDQAGAKTGMASIFSAVLMVLTLLFLTPFFYHLPQAVLASVILVAVYGLIDFKEARHLWKTDRRDLAMLTVTFFATLLTGIEQGIILGVVLSLVVVVYESSYPHYAILGKIPGTEAFRNVKRFSEAIEIAGVLMLRFDAKLFFANVNVFQTAIEEEVAKRPDLKLIIINAEAINTLDSTAIHMLRDFSMDLKKSHVELIFAGLKGPVRDIMVKNGIVTEMGANHFFDNMHEALENFDGEKISTGPVKFQSNLDTGGTND